MYCKYLDSQWNDYTHILNYIGITMKSGIAVGSFHHIFSKNKDTTGTGNSLPQIAKILRN